MISQALELIDTKSCKSFSRIKLKSNEENEKKPSSDKQKGHLFEIENAQIFINLLFYVTSNSISISE